VQFKDKRAVVYGAAICAVLLPAGAFGQAASPPVGAAAPVFKPTYEQDTAKPGQDYHSFRLALPIASLCQSACMADVQCHAWEYDPRQSPPTCWLKSKDAAPVKAPGHAAGVVQPDANTSPPASPPIVFRMAILSAAQNPVHCIDVPNSQFVQGAKLQMWDCNNTNAQLFSFNLTSQQLMIGNLCVQVPANAAAGAAAVLGPCSAQPNVQWSVKQNGNWAQLVGLKGLCLSSGGQTQAPDGTPLQIAACANTAAQYWGFNRMSGQ
jgi:hypothetical protein